MINIEKYIDLELWSEVGNTLRKNILRTVLTSLGVVFAVLILVLLLGASKGLQNGFNKLFAGNAQNSMFIWSQKTSMEYDGFKRGRRIELKLEDVNLLKKKFPEIEILSPRINLWRSTSKITYKGKAVSAQINGDFETIDQIFKKDMLYGRFLNHNDLVDARKVCVLGVDTYKLLFNVGENPLFKEITVNGSIFKIIGVFDRNDQMSFEDPNSIIIPYSIFQKVFNSGNAVGWMAIKIKDNVNIPDIISPIKKFMKNKHRVHPEDTRAFGSFDLSEIFNKIFSFTFVLEMFSFFVGVFSMVAGVIAVGNILLITIKERTKEIGVRRAIGAKPSQIRKLILLESVSLTFIAGLFGFMISIGILHFIHKVTENQKGLPFYNPTISLGQFAILFSLMLILSTLIGLVPAQRALKIKPIEALKED